MPNIPLPPGFAFKPAAMVRLRVILPLLLSFVVFRMLLVFNFE